MILSAGTFVASAEVCSAGSDIRKQEKNFLISTLNLEQILHDNPEVKAITVADECGLEIATGSAFSLTLESTAKIDGQSVAIHSASLVQYAQQLQEFLTSKQTKSASVPSSPQTRPSESRAAERIAIAEDLADIPSQSAPVTPLPSKEDATFTLVLEADNGSLLLEKNENLIVSVLKK